ncbi:hypothetical protein F5Y04DRAFT_256162 [Hypomontagnella monticulosa]|nr:hypothetical protein F5Y04DRAFT_256162 [Hypomontagnella monticulosa]
MDSESLPRRLREEAEELVRRVLGNPTLSAQAAQRRSEVESDLQRQNGCLAQLQAEAERVAAQVTEAEQNLVAAVRTRRSQPDPPSGASSAKKRRVVGPDEDEEDVDVGGGMVGEDEGAWEVEGGEEDVDDGDDDEPELTDQSIDTDSEMETKKRVEAKKGMKKGRPTEDEKRNALVQDFNELATELKTVAQDQPYNLKKAAAKSRNWIQKHRDPIESIQDLLLWVPSAETHIQGAWTRALEELFQQDLQQDPYLQYLRGCGLPGSNARFMPMWKKVCRLRRVFPIQIISPLQHLQYGATDPVVLADGTTRPNPVWTPWFCEHLTRLAIGGPWGNNMDLLSLLLRYVVACRTDDRGPIPFILGKAGDGSDFMKLMDSKLGKNRDPTKPIPRIHQEVRREIQARSLDVPWHSQMMRNLEKLAYIPGKEPNVGLPEAGFESRLYQVTTEDLRKVERAVSGCKDLGRPLFMKVRDAARIASHGRGFDFPKKYSHVQDIQIAWYKHERRLLAKRHLEPPVEKGRGENDGDITMSVNSSLGEDDWAEIIDGDGNDISNLRSSHGSGIENLPGSEDNPESQGDPEDYDEDSDHA